jgi:hypothetical protein
MSGNAARNARKRASPASRPRITCCGSRNMTSSAYIASTAASSKWANRSWWRRTAARLSSSDMALLPRPRRRPALGASQWLTPSRGHRALQIVPRLPAASRPSSTAGHRWLLEAYARCGRVVEDPPPRITAEAAAAAVARARRFLEAAHGAGIRSRRSPELAAPHAELLARSAIVRGKAHPRTIAQREAGTCR